MSGAVIYMVGFCVVFAALCAMDIVFQYMGARG